MANASQLPLFDSASSAASKARKAVHLRENEEDIDFGPLVEVVAPPTPRKPLPHEQAVLDRVPPKKGFKKKPGKAEPKTQEMKCGVCKREHGPGDRFCAGCGSAIACKTRLHVEPFDPDDAEAIERVLDALKSKRKLSYHFQRKTKYDRITPRPIDCALLAVDCSTSASGWAFFVRGMLVRSGIAGPAEDLRSICLDVHSNDVGLQSVMVIEEPYDRMSSEGQEKEDGYKTDHRQVSRSLNRRLGNWIDAWTWTGAKGSKSRVVRVQASTWMSYTKGLPFREKRAVRLPFEEKLAQELSGLPLKEDEATAFLIGQWGMIAAQTLKAIPKSQRRLIPSE